MTSRLPDGSPGRAAPGPEGESDVGTPPSRPAPAASSRIGGGRGAHRAPRSAGRLAAVVGGLVLGVGAAALLLVHPWSGGTAGTDEPDPSLARIAPDVVAWLEQEVPADTPVTASDGVREVLEAAEAGERVGGPADGALRVVEGQPGEGSLVLARFAAADGVALSVVDPSPVAPTAAELDRRQSLAAAVLANPVAGATGRAAEALRTGDVDARLLGLLAGLVSRMDVHVADLPPAHGEPAAGPPARRLLVDRAGGQRLTPGAPATEELVAFVAAQRPPFAPDTVEQTDDGLLIGYHYVSGPDAAVSTAT